MARLVCSTVRARLLAERHAAALAFHQGDDTVAAFAQTLAHHRVDLPVAQLLPPIHDGRALADPPFPTQPTPAVVAPMALPAVLARPAQMGVQGSARFPVRPDGPAAGFAADR